MRWERQPNLLSPSGPDTATTHPKPHHPPTHGRARGTPQRPEATSIGAKQRPTRKAQADRRNAQWRKGLQGGREAPALCPRRTKAKEIAAEESLQGPKSNPPPQSPKSHSTPTIARPLMTTRAPCHLWTHCPTIPGDEAPEEGGHIDNSQKEHFFQVLKTKLRQQDL